MKPEDTILTDEELCPNIAETEALRKQARKTASIIRAERLDRPELRVKCNELLLEFAKWYEDYKRHPIHRYPFNIAYLAEEEKLKEYSSQLLALIPDVDVEGIFLEIEKAISEESYPDEEDQWYTFTIPKSWWQAIKNKYLKASKGRR